MQAKPWTPRIIILIAFILLACPCVHADRYFTVSHSIVNNRVCFSRFWEKGGTEEKTAATIRPDSPAEFSLGFCHENVSVVSLSVAFGPLVTEEPGSFETCDYNVETFNPSNQTSYAEPAARGTATYTDIYPNSDGTSKAYMGTVQSDFFCKKIQHFAKEIQQFCKIFRAFQCNSVLFRAWLNAV